jgi:Creatinine amidohydrolase
MTEVLWNRMTAAELQRAAKDGAIVLLPVASTEQHGPHLATGVDTFLGGEVCRRTAELVAKQQPIVVTPTVWMGLAEHHVAYGGTFPSRYRRIMRSCAICVMPFCARVSRRFSSSTVTAEIVLRWRRSLRTSPGSSMPRSRRRRSMLCRINTGPSPRCSRIRRVSDTLAKPRRR